MKVPLTNTSWHSKLILNMPPSPPLQLRAAMTGATSSLSLYSRNKVVVIMGTTGSGKTQLAIDLATLFPSEIINSDKMQVYAGLDITTNKIPLEDRHGVPHHLLGSVDPDDGEVTPSDFRSLGQSIIGDIISRQKLPFIVGGSNSFIYALLTERLDPTTDFFGAFDSLSTELKYKCCFLWVNVSFPVLDDYLRKRVDNMLASGMFEELVRFYDQCRFAPSTRTGLRKTIGFPEFDRCFKSYPPRRGDTWAGLDPLRRAAYEEAIREMKDNTCQLAKRQIAKIQRLRDSGWNLRRLDATEAVRAMMMAPGPRKGLKWAEIWQSQVQGPSVKIVKRFLEE
ncbi:adenylate isopentenyltransferase-like [Punica granatum]|uniref:Uncharacterized protein n=2 Tax=Punica granatum TaxID=22663 RepID=A0A2I0IUT1_PUNGR|nr:adenylate isopentenyltransferase-like [Punica granatum]PKI47533.1 hypothetical protein CRG98_032123 [Punica granatum]